MKLFAHQEAALEWFKTHTTGGLWWEMGSGKTAVGIEVARIWLTQGKISKVLVITPLQVIPHWCSELRKFAPELSFITVTGSSKKKEASLDRPVKVYITNYDALTYTGDALKDFVDKETLLIFDESTKIKRPRAKRSLTAQTLAMKTRNVILMTGTPITNSLFDAWAQVFLLDLGKSLGQNFWYFRRLYFFTVDKNNWIWRPTKGTEDSIHNALADNGSFVKKCDCLDLPPKVYERMDVPMNQRTKELYDQFAKDLLLKLGDNQTVEGRTILSEIIKLHEIANGFVKTIQGESIDIANSKIEFLVEMLQDELYGQQVVIWCPYRALIQRLYTEIKKGCPDIASGVRTLYGDTDKDERRTVEPDMQSGAIRVLIANPEVGGMGINLTPCSTMIYFANTWKVETRVQSEDRIHRPGATAEKITYIDLIVPHTVDATIFNSLRNKMDISKRVMNVRKALEGTEGEENEDNDQRDETATLTTEVTNVQANN
jgi:SNF2 family DNA or RNA helicase